MDRGSMLSLIACAMALLPSQAAERSLDMYWVDVEGGAATLIVTPQGESILIDTGMPGERDPKRIFEATKTAGIKQIDHLITTHFHIDHFGGAPDLARMLPIRNVYDNGIPDHNPDNPNDTTNFARQIQPYRDMKVQQRIIIKPGETIPLRQGDVPLTLRCVAGMQQMGDCGGGERVAVDCDSGREKPKDTSDNANSLVFLLSYGDFDMFDGGDLTWNVEAKLACPETRVRRVDVYDVNHHGLDQSNNPLLVSALSPTVAIMSNGTSKGCGPETFKTLKNTPSIKAIYQIHRNLRADSENNTDAELIANQEKECTANFVKLSVDASATFYTVSIPGTGHSRRFEVR